MMFVKFPVELLSFVCLDFPILIIDRNGIIQYVIFCDWLLSLSIFFKRFYLFIFRESGREGEREGEKYQCVVAFHVAPTGDLAHNPGICPDWESNLRPFGSQPTLSPLSYTSQGQFCSFSK